MPIATNPESGDVMFLDNDSQWKPAKTAVNPQTREMMAFDGKDWQKVTTHGHGVLGYIDDAVRAVASGMTFGYADEFAAKMGELTGVGGKKGDYEGNLTRERARDAAAPSAIRIPGEIAGAVAGGVAAAPVGAAAGAATGLSKLPGAVKAIAGGAAAGGLYASGEADSGLENRLAAVPMGAAVGAAGGAVLAGIGRVAQHVFSPENRATAEIERAISRDNGLNNLPSVRENTGTLADVGGENVKGLLERVSQTPGAGRTDLVPFLTERQNTQLSRVSEDLKTLTGTNKSALQATEEQMAQRTSAAKPLYEKAYDEGDKPLWSNEMERLTAVPEVQSAMKGAVSSWQRTQIANGYGAMNPGAIVDLEKGGILKFTNGKVPVFPNLQFWDYTKNALDDMISAEIKVDGSMSKKGRDLTIIVGKLRDELDKQVPTYKGARDAWAGPTAYMNAVKLGNNITTMGAEEFSAALSKMNASEKEAVRIGALSKIFEQIGSSGTKLADVTAKLRSPQMRGKISAIMPDAQSAAKWDQILKFEVGSSEMVGRALKGSPTARRILESQDAGSVAGDLVMSAFSGHPPLSLFSKVLQGTAGKVKDTIRSKTDAIIAQRLMQGIGKPNALTGK
jgi:hypothetical protein